jgi:ribonuclease P protein subunit RPR2
MRLATGRSMSGVEADGSTLLALGLAVERYRVQLILEESLAEAEAIRRQLDAYAVDLRSTYLAERDRSQELANALRELTQTYEFTVRGLAIAVEAKDEYTGGHLHRVSRYGMAITAVVAPDHSEDPQFEYGFLLHDVGKLVVPDAVLMKDGPLDEIEWAMIKGHPEAGRTILDKIPFLAGANEIVHAHHERWDGTGYPRGLKGEQIPLGARIFPLADVFDAMTTTRPYRSAMSVEAARLEVQNGSGTQFCPEAVDAFMSIPVEELDLVRCAVRPDSSA